MSNCSLLVHVNSGLLILADKTLDFNTVLVNAAINMRLTEVNYNNFSLLVLILTNETLL